MRRILIVLIIMAVTGVTAPQILEWLGHIARLIIEKAWPFFLSLINPILHGVGLA